MVDDFTCFDFAGQVFGHTREDSGFVGRAGQYDDCAAEFIFQSIHRGAQHVDVRTIDDGG